MVLDRAAALAAERGVEGCVLTLDAPTYQAVMTHAESAELRAKYYEAWVTRGIRPGPARGPLGQRPADRARSCACATRRRRLVGFKSYAEFSLATKMADSPTQVIDFLRDLARRSKPVAAAELESLDDYAGRKLEPWDVAFYPSG